MTSTVDKGLANVERECVTGVPLDCDEEPDLEVELVAEEESFLDQDGVPVELQGRQFQDIDALHDELEVLGLTDYKFRLNDDGFATTRDPKHCGGTRFIRLKLDRYSKGWFGDWGFCNTQNVQQINQLTPSGRTAKREPDVNFWHYEKCVKSGDWMKVRRRAGSKFDLDPDIFFQFSWRNSEAKEFDFMNDLLTLGGVGPGNMGPRVGFLVRVRRVGGNDVGINVYKVYNGRTVADAFAQTHGCTHMYYDHAAGNDVKIVIPAADFGFTGLQSFFPSFKLSLQELWEYANLG
jgi:hypothetical protein